MHGQGRMLMVTCGVHVSDGSMKDFDLPMSVDVIGHRRVLLAWVWLLIVKICWCVDCRCGCCQRERRCLFDLFTCLLACWLAFMDESPVTQC